MDMTREKLNWTRLKEEFPDVATALLKEWNERDGFVPYEQGYVYVIQACDTQYLKIGKTKNPDRRILQIAPQMPFRTQYVRVWRSNFMSMGEKYLHSVFSDYRANGEWFDFGSANKEEKACRIGMLLNSFCTDNSVKHAYGNYIENLVKKATTKKGEHLLFLQTFFLDTAGAGAAFIADIENLFSEIQSELFPDLPENIGGDVSYFKEMLERAAKDD